MVAAVLASGASGGGAVTRPHCQTSGGDCYICSGATTLHIDDPAASFEAAVFGQPPSEAGPNLGATQQWNADIAPQIEPPFTIYPELRMVGRTVTRIDNLAVPCIILGLRDVADDS